MPFTQIVNISFQPEIFEKFFGESKIYKPQENDFHKERAKGGEKGQSPSSSKKSSYRKTPKTKVEAL
jgi:hypothetical protein